jgi:hypothetical protein
MLDPLSDRGAFPLPGRERMPLEPKAASAKGAGEGLFKRSRRGRANAST